MEINNNTPATDDEIFAAISLGLLAIILTVFAWAIAANVANSFFLKGLQPFELAGAIATIATFGLAILDSLVGRSHAQAISRQELVRQQNQLISRFAYYSGSPKY